MRLGALIALAFAAAFVPRGLLLRRLVLSASAGEQPVRQFALEMGACLFAGVIAGLGMEASIGFLWVSGWKLVLGAMAAGFYLGLEGALLRQREIVLRAREAGYDPVWRPKRLRSLSRRFLTVAATATVLLLGIFGLIWAGDVDWLSTLDRDPAVLAQARSSVIVEIAFVMAVLLLGASRLILLYAGNLKLLFNTITEGLARVRQGDLSVRLPLATSDEFGLIAAEANSMIEGLSHRLALLDALKVAEDVQRNLLPAAPPDIPGLDIAALSDYCDETGGDYYDFIQTGPGRTAIVVADVAGHGVGPALLMASARATVRMAAAMYPDPGSVVSAVNSRVAEDVYGTGRFLTLFYLEIDVAARMLRWVRAGHDPAFVVRPGDAEATLLGGGGPPLGVVEGYRYVAESCPWPEAGLVFIGTDGIWETTGEGEGMFGKRRLVDLLRKNLGRPTAQVLDAVRHDLEAFSHDKPREDDITMAAVAFP
ncbi:MAG: serine phosphatase RsbU, regulator of sigma subunit [Solidesulfovibrio magneticus str. Maddingley MBC34]|uniref:Serine phosphatase RsbU, regulator of sigma subunit n=1 Tax=Solidesulfovibrio magneticus str. Maddingley MBC34 TaxID=1206767 RepID=K6GNN2_9BACT|nr:MAG: serine phosphatase RsbU, regulator of sigma subunit [Solidesulfovibrio magneticus str. Maddingley MBC34]